MNAVTESARFPDQFCRAEKLAPEERDHLILEHMPQVRLVARRIHDRLPGNVSLDDLVSTGVIGLISAIDRFDPSRQIHLRTYAEHKIKGAILDSLRQLDWAPRRDRKHAKQIDAAIAVSEQRLQRSPTEKEVATELNLTVDRYHQWQVRIRGLNLGRLESAGSGDSENRDLIRSISSDKREWPAAVLERSELKRVLAAAIAEIPAIEKTVLSLYYGDELTLRQISKIVGLHESRMSQIKTRAILRLRNSMTTLWPAARQGPILKDNPEPGRPPAPAVTPLATGHPKPHLLAQATTPQCSVRVCWQPPASL